MWRRILTFTSPSIIQLFKQISKNCKRAATGLISGRVLVPIDNRFYIFEIETSRLLHIVYAHDDRIENAIFSFDGSRIITCSRDTRAKVWNSSTGHIELTMEEHIEAILDCSISNDGTQIATVCEDQKLRVWDALDGTLKKSFHADGCSCCFSPDGERIICDDIDQAKIWNCGTGIVELNLKFKDYVIFCLFSPDGNRILIISTNLSIWNAQSGEHELTLEDDQFMHGTFSSDGKRVLAIGIDRVVRIWDAFTGATQELAISGHIRPNHAVFSNDDNLLLLINLHSNSVIVLDAHNLAVVSTLFLPPTTCGTSFESCIEV